MSEIVEKLTSVTDTHVEMEVPVRAELRSDIPVYVLLVTQAKTVRWKSICV
jgi:hypothetical protein